MKVKGFGDHLGDGKNMWSIGKKEGANVLL